MYIAFRFFYLYKLVFPFIPWNIFSFHLLNFCTAVNTLCNKHRKWMNSEFWRIYMYSLGRLKLCLKCIPLKCRNNFYILVFKNIHNDQTTLFPYLKTCYPYYLQTNLQRPNYYTVSHKSRAVWYNKELRQNGNFSWRSVRVI